MHSSAKICQMEEGSSLKQNGKMQVAETYGEQSKQKWDKISTVSCWGEVGVNCALALNWWGLGMPGNGMVFTTANCLNLRKAEKGRPRPSIGPYFGDACAAGRAADCECSEGARALAVRSLAAPAAEGSFAISAGWPPPSLPRPRHLQSPGESPPSESETWVSRQQPFLPPSPRER